MNKIKLFRFKFKYLNFRMIFWVLALTLLGIVVIGSAAPGERYEIKQFIGLCLGVVIMMTLSMLDYRVILKLHWVEYGICIMLLLAVLVPGIGKEVNGARRWIPLVAGFNIQPSEFAKILMILFWAWLYGNNPDNVNKWKRFFLTLPLTLIPLMLIVREPDLSTTILITTLFITALFISGFSYKKFGIILGVLVPIVVAGVVYIQSPNQKLLKGYQLNRIMAFLNPDEFDDLRYQQNNAEMAIGSGQLYGKGLYNDSADSVKNGNYIAEPQTDFIFAIVGEEMGFIGSCIVIGLLLLITIESILTGSRAVDMPGKIICFGMAAITTFQTFINIGVVTSLLPNTGIPLPFVSYGLSSLITMFAGVGLVLSVRMTKKLSVEEAMNEHRFNCT